MTTDWKDLPTLQDVAEAQAQGWEIETGSRIEGHPWIKWFGENWSSVHIYRARPRQPKMQVVKSLCWRGPGGQLAWWDISGRVGAGFVRFPAGDIEGEVAV